jgi:hypothetical protein
MMAYLKGLVIFLSAFLKVLIGLLLFLIAIGLLAILAPFGVLHTIIYSMYMEFKLRRIGKKNRGLAYLAMSLKNNALTLDISGGVICKETLNAVLFKRDPRVIKIGNPRVSISAYTGFNTELNLETKAGRVLGWILNRLDKNHIENAAESNRPYLD